MIFFFSSRRRHTRWTGDWSSDVCSSDLVSSVTVRVTETLVLDRALEVGAQSEQVRSEERRVGKECRCGWWPDREKKKSSGRQGRWHGRRSMCTPADQGAPRVTSAARLTA